MINCIICGVVDEIKSVGGLSPNIDIHHLQLCDQCRYRFATNWDVPIKSIHLILASIKHDKYLINKLPEEVRVQAKDGWQKRVRYFTQKMHYYGVNENLEGFDAFLDDYNEKYINKWYNLDN